jgi:hypothetical protein
MEGIHLRSFGELAGELTPSKLGTEQSIKPDAEKLNGRVPQNSVW